MLSVDGATVTDELATTTAGGATLVVRDDGTFDYDPSTLTDLSSALVGDVIYDSFV